MDFLWALGFLLWYEVLSWPLRSALDGTRAPADVRRLLSRIAGPLLLALPIWGLAHVWGGVLSQPAGLLWVAAASTWALRRALRSGGLRRALAWDDRSRAPEVATVALFLAFVAVRRWVPEMTAYPIDTTAAEKFMNAMMYWSSWHAPALPPDDYWLSGHPLAYYYWGHFQWAWVGRIAGFPVELALNLGFCRLVTLVFEASFLLARAVGLGVGGSVAAGVASAWAGNPRAVGEAWKVWRAPPPGYDWGAYDFWRPSRAMSDAVVDEFPAFSALLGDFHAHHHALPWLIGWIALTLAAARWMERREGRPVTPWRILAPLAPASGWALAAWLALGLAAALSNVWNLPVMAGAMFLAVVASFPRGFGFTALVALLQLALLGLAAAGVRLLLGDGAQPLPVAADAGPLEQIPVRWLPAQLRSTVPQLFAMWGLPGLVLAGAAGLRAVETGRRDLWVRVLGGGLLVAAALALPDLLPLGSFWAWTGVACWGAALSRRPDRWLSRPALFALVGALGVLGGSEILFVDDAMAGEYERYNSYFKLTYPVWPVWVVAACAAVGAAALRRPPSALARVLRAAAAVALAAVVLAGAVYPLCATPVRLIAARRGDDPPRSPTLDAFGFVAHRPPFSEEARMLEWIRRHVPPGDVVVEGSGAAAYGYVGRVASLAGRPIPLGWSHHEGQWRGLEGHRLAAERKAAVDALYRAGSPDELRRRAAELGARWVLYGRVERESYGAGEDPGAALRTLRAAAPVAAAFPPERPTVLLFDLRERTGGEE